MLDAESVDVRIYCEEQHRTQKTANRRAENNTLKTFHRLIVNTRTVAERVMKANTTKGPKIALGPWFGTFIGGRWNRESSLSL